MALLIKYDATVDVKDRIDWTPLFYSVLNGNEKVVKLLMNHEDEVFSLDDKDAQGKTVFHICAEKGNSRPFDFAFTSTNLKRFRLFFSLSIGSVSIGKLLLSHGANASAVDELGQQPLHRAAAFGNLFPLRLY